jgi:hypothetical protein
MPSSSATRAPLAYRPALRSAFPCPRAMARDRWPAITAGRSFTRRVSAGRRWMLRKPRKTRPGESISLGLMTRTGWNSRRAATSCLRPGRKAIHSTTSSTRMPKWTANRSRRRSCW